MTNVAEDDASPGIAQVPARRRQHHQPGVLILNYSGFITGDDAMFEVLLGVVRRIYGPNVAVDALTAMPERTKVRYAVRETGHLYDFASSLHTWKSVVRMVARADMVLIGGGDILEGQSSLALLVLLARLYGVPVPIVGIGVLMPKNARQHRILRWTVQQSQFVATRDPESARMLRMLGKMSTPIDVFPDLAASYPFDDDTSGPDVLQSLGITTTRLYIVVNLRSPEPWQYPTVWGDSEYETIAATCRWVIDELNLDVVCASMTNDSVWQLVASDVPSDDAVLQALITRIARPERAHFVSGECSPAQMVAVLGGARVTIAMRLHALLLAATRGTPVVALNYARKVEAFMESIGQKPRCVPVARVTHKALSAAVEDALAERVAIRTELRAWRQHAQGRFVEFERTLFEVAHAPPDHLRARRALARVLIPLLTLALRTRAKWKGIQT